jgi:hypothetical protein
LQVGATAFVGALEGKRGVSYVVLGKTIFGWVFTLIFVGLLASLFMALGLRTPNLRSSKALNDVEGAVVKGGMKLAMRVNDECKNGTVAAVRSCSSAHHASTAAAWQSRSPQCTALLAGLDVILCPCMRLACQCTPSNAPRRSVGDLALLPLIR